MRQPSRRSQKPTDRTEAGIEHRRGFTVIEEPTLECINNISDDHSPRTASQRFADLFQRLERTETYHIEAAKVEIAEQIYVAMENPPVSKAELARRLGKSRQYVTKILQGSANFTLESLVKIALALGCQLKPEMVPAASTISATSPRGLRLVYHAQGLAEEGNNERIATAA